MAARQVRAGSMQMTCGSRAPSTWMLLTLARSLGCVPRCSRTYARAAHAFGRVGALVRALWLTTVAAHMRRVLLCMGKKSCMCRCLNTLVYMATHVYLMGTHIQITFWASTRGGIRGSSLFLTVRPNNFLVFCLFWFFLFLGRGSYPFNSFLVPDSLFFRS